MTASSLAVLQEISGGRFDLGIGRGDSAIRVLGKSPTTMATLEEAVHVIRALAEGRPIEYEGATLQLPWSAGHRLPVWIAGYGPVALKMTGRIADGAMLQIADPDLIRWFASQVHDSAREAGRDPQAVRIMAAAPAHVGDLADGRDRVRWFPALVGNHVVDLVNKYQGELPEALTHYIRGREGYDYLHHAEVGSANAAFVTDDIVDRFGIVGDADGPRRQAPRPRRRRASTSSTSTS